jgi:cell division ATPase FtsA
MGKAESLGVLRGEVRNIDKTVRSVREAIQRAKESMSDQRYKIEINMVHVGIAGQHIKSLQHRNSISRVQTEDEITQEDCSFADRCATCRLGRTRRDSSSSPTKKSDSRRYQRYLDQQVLFCK